MKLVLPERKPFLMTLNTVVTLAVLEEAQTQIIRIMRPLFLLFNKVMIGACVVVTVTGNIKLLVPATLVGVENVPKTIFLLLSDAKLLLLILLLLFNAKLVDILINKYTTNKNGILNLVVAIVTVRFLNIFFSITKSLIILQLF